MRFARESDLQRTILDYLRLHRIFAWRQNVGAMKAENRFVRFGWPGLPDIFAVVGGRIIGIEVKRAKGLQSRAQFQFQQDFTRAGGIYLLARSLEDVITGLDIP